MKIEKMTSDRLSQVAEISEICFSDPWSEEAFKEEFLNPSAFYFTAEEAGKVVGFGGFHKVLDEGYITNIAVISEYRKNGVGSKVLAKIVDCCRELSLSFVSLEVRVSNLAAIGLYKKFGFELQGTRKNFYSHPTEDAYIMTLFLKD